MARKAWLEDRAHTLEEEYIWRTERALIARLREGARRAHERQVLKDRLGDAGDPLLAKLQAAGFTAENLALLHLVPLVEVAWADGAVSVPERRRILAMAARGGIMPNTPAGTQLTVWLDQCPGQEFFNMAFDAIRLTLAQKHHETRSAVARDLVERCTKVAEATGEMLGLVRISHDERECLTKLSQGLTEKATPR